MSESDDDNGLTTFEVRLDDLSMRRLMKMCKESKIAPRAVLSGIIRDVLEDDAVSHASPNKALH